MTSVELPDSLSSIGGDAFVSCPSLQEIRIPEGMSYIHDEAFDPGVTLIVTTGTYAEEYAKQHQYRYEVQKG